MLNVPNDTGHQNGGDTVAHRVVAIRKEFRLTQEQVAERSGGKLRRIEVVKIEGGLNKATSDKIRAGLAAAFGLSREDLAAYLEGQATLADVLHRENVVEPQDRYPNRVEAAKFARSSGIEEEPIQIVMSYDLKSDNDPTPVWWLDQIRAEASRMQFARKDPGKVERDRQVDLDAQEQELRELEAQRAAAKAKRKAQQGK